MFFLYALIALEEMLILCQMSCWLTERYKLYSKFVLGHCFDLKLNFLVMVLR